MTKVVKMCDIPVTIAVKVFKDLNYKKIRVKSSSYFRCNIITDTEPKDLKYPEGWYYAKGEFRNKHNTTTGIYEAVPMFLSNGERWEDHAKYCAGDVPKEKS